MALLPLLYFPDERLHLKSNKVTVFDATLHQLIEDMLDTLLHEDGVGLAAPQVNVLQQVIVAGINGTEDRQNMLVLINPEIIAQSGHELLEEGCLSVPQIYASIKRAQIITVKYQDRNAHEHIVEYTGFAAHCLQHEIDHLYGKVFVDYLSHLKQNMIKRKLKKILESNRT